MHILITGAGGFVGAALVSRLLAGAGPAFTRLTLVDRQFSALPDDPRVTALAGDIADTGIWADALANGGADLVFHLASVPGGLAERDFDLGMAANLGGTLGLLDALRRQQSPARLVFASSVAVYGDPLPDQVDDATPARPGLSYGMQKLVGELLVTDYSRRGFIDGSSLRLPGIVARPPAPSGLISAFMSEVMWAARDHRPVCLPVSEQGVCWWMSVKASVDALLHAAALPGQGRVWLPPVLRLTLGELVAALTDRFGAFDVTYAPDPVVEAKFARQPPLIATAARAAGFRDDGDVAGLITAAVG
ncbi:NAD-dependent epimerase/dehydratase family protein [Niveispirillum irakense]|uniref:NAD-dependent epimerase/dehydratase family protein n=1 Tax=Niveispirillum irakense TaxID=34011 RepID=UPI0004089647|nr:NAD-dependent epimerase/dehydratase family protein [Niveispirillum irakense]